MALPNETVPGAAGQGGNEGSAPEGGQAQTYDYERGYNELRPEFTRTTQQLSEAQQNLEQYQALFEALQDPDSQAEALEALGLELAEQEAAEPVDDLADPLESEVSDLREQIVALQEARESEESQLQDQELIQLRDTYLDDAIDYIGQSTQQEFTEHEQEVLGNLAITMENEDGVPDVEAAYNALYGAEGAVEAAFDRRVQHKLGATQAPFGSGSSAPTRPSTRGERVNYIDERIRAIEALQ